MDLELNNYKEKQPVTVELRPKGPAVIKGEFIFIDEDGQEHKNKTVVSICRCGRTQKMPYCDGSHK